jgi:hypothetical protein
MIPRAPDGHRNAGETIAADIAGDAASALPTQRNRSRHPHKRLAHVSFSGDGPVKSYKVIWRIGWDVGAKKIDS